MHIHKYAHLPNSLGQENELSKSSNTNLMKKKKKKVALVKNFSANMSYLVKLSSRDTK